MCLDAALSLPRHRRAQEYMVARDLIRRAYDGDVHCTAAQARLHASAVAHLPASAHVRSPRR